MSPPTVQSHHTLADIRHANTMIRFVFMRSNAVVNNVSSRGALEMQKSRHVFPRSSQNGTLMQIQPNLNREDEPNLSREDEPNLSREDEPNLSREDEPSLPDRMSTNRHGLFNWDRWDGSLWNTEETTFYKNQKISQQISYWEFLLAKAREKLETAEHSYELDRYWVVRYNDLLNASRGLKPFVRVYTDSCIIKFLVMTAPILARDNFRKTFQQLDMGCYEILLLVNALTDISRIKATANHSTLLFKSQVHRHRCKRQELEDRIDLRLRRKLERQRIKTELGYEAVQRLSNKSQKLCDPVPTEIQNGFDTWPSSWAVEGFYSQMHFLLARATSRYFECTTYARLRMDSISAQGRLKIRYQLNRYLLTLAPELHSSIRILHDLNEDLAAIRYFRIHKFSDRDMTREVRVGRTLFTALQNKSPNGSISVILNSRLRNRRISITKTKVDPPAQQKPHIASVPPPPPLPLPTPTRSGKPPPSPRSKNYISPPQPAILAPTTPKRRGSQVKPLASTKRHSRHTQHHDGPRKLFDPSQDTRNPVAKVIVAVGGGRTRSLDEQLDEHAGKSVRALYLPSTYPPAPI